MADTLSATILQHLTMPEMPSWVVMVLENGEIRLAALTDNSLSIVPLAGFQLMGRFRNNLSYVSLALDTSDNTRTVFNSIVYAFAPRNQLTDMRQPYITMARYLGDGNYIGFDRDTMIVRMDISECGSLLAAILGTSDTGFTLFILDTATGDILHSRDVDVEFTSEIVHLGVDASGHIVLCAEEWLQIIDWRNNTVLFEFNTHDAEDGGIITPRWDGCYCCGGLCAVCPLYRPQLLHS